MKTDKLREVALKALKYNRLFYWLCLISLTLAIGANLTVGEYQLALWQFMTGFWIWLSDQNAKGWKMSQDLCSEILASWKESLAQLDSMTRLKAVKKTRKKT